MTNCIICKEFISVHDVASARPWEGPTCSDACAALETERASARYEWKAGEPPDRYHDALKAIGRHRLLVKAKKRHG